jgi:eukaryotic-like serine/threonine-protein kinase
MEAIAPDRRLAGRYVLEELIATGGMAAVWRARDQVLARLVAVKILREDLAADPGFVERFRREAIAAARLTSPFMVSVFDSGQDDGLSFMVMEYFEGRTLQDIIERETPVPPPRAVALILPVLSALEAAHEQGLIHRDVKPANVLVGPDGRVKVADFGIAKAIPAGADLTTTGAVLGTVRYLSPEQVEGSPVDERSDLYSVGVVLYELLTGRPPFLAQSDVATAMMRLTNHPPPPRNMVAGIPRNLEAMVLRGMARRPDDRFPSAAAMRSALERYADPGGATPQRGIPLAQPSNIEPGGGRRASTFRSWMLVPLVLILLSASVIVGGLALGRLELGGPLGIRQAEPTPDTGAGAATPLHLRTATDFDPLGDQSEHSQEAAAAIDGDPDSAWTTDHYNSASFGNLKPGVGLFVSLDRAARAVRLVVHSALPGWTFELKAGPSPSADAPSLAARGGATTFTVPPSGRIAIDLAPVRTKGLLIWITSLAPEDGRFAAAVGEVTVLGEAP